MEKIALLGMFTDEMIGSIRQACGDEFEVVHFVSPDEVPLAKGASYVVLRGTPIGVKELDILGSEVKLYHRWGVGYDNVDFAEAGKRGIPVAITTGVNAPCVAEMAVLLMLASYRRLPALMACAKNENDRAEKDAVAGQGQMLRGKKVGLVGLGNIGFLVSKYLRAFGAQVVYYDVRRIAPEKENELEITFLPFNELVSSCDIISLHLPLFDSTYHMFNMEVFKKMKRSALVINTSRGGIIDTEDLVEALRKGVIAGAALDTTEEEPLPAGHPLLDMNQVILTPHVGGSSKDLSEEMVACIMNNIRLTKQGILPDKRYIVNGEYLKAAADAVNSNA